MPTITFTDPATGHTQDVNFPTTPDLPTLKMVQAGLFATAPNKPVATTGALPAVNPNLGPQAVQNLTGTTPSATSLDTGIQGPNASSVTDNPTRAATSLLAKPAPTATNTVVANRQPVQRPPITQAQSGVTQLPESQMAGIVGTDRDPFMQPKQLYNEVPVTPPDVQEMIDREINPEEGGSGADGSLSMGREREDEPNHPGFSRGRLPAIEQEASNIATHGLPNVLPTAAGIIAAPFGMAAGSPGGPVGSAAGGFVVAAAANAGVKSAEERLFEAIDPKGYAQWKAEDEEILANDPNAAFAADLATTMPFQSPTSALSVAALKARAAAAGIQMSQKEFEDYRQGKFDPSGLALRGGAAALMGGEPTSFGRGISEPIEGLVHPVERAGSASYMRSTDPASPVRTVLGTPEGYNRYDQMDPSAVGGIRRVGLPEGEQNNPAYVPYETPAQSGGGAPAATPIATPDAGGLSVEVAPSVPQVQQSVQKTVGNKMAKANRVTPVATTQATAQAAQQPQAPIASPDVPIGTSDSMPIVGTAADPFYTPPVNPQNVPQPGAQNALPNSSPPDVVTGQVGQANTAPQALPEAAAPARKGSKNARTTAAATTTGNGPTESVLPVAGTGSAGSPQNGGASDQLPQPPVVANVPGHGPVANGEVGVAASGPGGVPSATNANAVGPNGVPIGTNSQAQIRYEVTASNGRKLAYDVQPLDTPVQAKDSTGVRIKANFMATPVGGGKAIPLKEVPDTWVNTTAQVDAKQAAANVALKQAQDDLASYVTGNMQSAIPGVLNPVVAAKAIKLVTAGIRAGTVRSVSDAAQLLSTSGATGLGKYADYITAKAHKNTDPIPPGQNRRSVFSAERYRNTYDAAGGKDVADAAHALASAPDVVLQQAHNVRTAVLGTGTNALTPAEHATVMHILASERIPQLEAGLARRRAAWQTEHDDLVPQAKALRLQAANESNKRAAATLRGKATNIEKRMAVLKDQIAGDYNRSHFAPIDPATLAGHLADPRIAAALDAHRQNFMDPVQAMRQYTNPTATLDQPTPNNLFMSQVPKAANGDPTATEEAQYSTGTGNAIPDKATSSGSRFASHEIKGNAADYINDYGVSVEHQLNNDVPRYLKRKFFDAIMAAKDKAGNPMAYVSPGSVRKVAEMDKAGNNTYHTEGVRKGDKVYVPGYEHLGPVEVLKVTNDGNMVVNAEPQPSMQQNPVTVSQSVLDHPPAAMVYDGKMYHDAGGIADAPSRLGSGIKAFEMERPDVKTGRGMVTYRAYGPENMVREWEDATYNQEPLVKHGAEDNLFNTTRGVLTEAALSNPLTAAFHAMTQGNILTGMTADPLANTHDSHMVTKWLRPIAALHNLFQAIAMDANHPTFQAIEQRLVEAGAARIRPFEKEVGKGAEEGSISRLGARILTSGNQNNPMRKAAGVATRVVGGVTHGVSHYTHDALFGMPQGTVLNRKETAFKMGLDMRLRVLAEMHREAQEGNVDPRRIRDNQRLLGDYVRKPALAIDYMKNALPTPFSATTLPHRMAEAAQVIGRDGIVRSEDRAKAFIRYLATAAMTVSSVIAANAINRFNAGHDQWENEYGHRYDTATGIKLHGKMLYMPTRYIESFFSRPADMTGLPQYLASYHKGDPAGVNAEQFPVQWLNDVLSEGGGPIGDMAFRAAGVGAHFTVDKQSGVPTTQRTIPDYYPIPKGHNAIGNDAAMAANRLIGMGLQSQGNLANGFENSVFPALSVPGYNQRAQPELSREFKGGKAAYYQKMNERRSDE